LAQGAPASFGVTTAANPHCVRRYPRQASRFEFFKLGNQKKGKLKNMPTASMLFVVGRQMVKGKMARVAHVFCSQTTSHYRDESMRAGNHRRAYRNLKLGVTRLAEIRHRRGDLPGHLTRS
jgi:hypothetical protein